MAGRVGADADQKLRDDQRVFIALLLATVVCSLMSLPFSLAGLAFGGWGVVLGIRLLGRLAKRSRVGLPARGHLGIAVGLGAIAFMLLQLGGQALYLPASLDYQSCLGGAGTLTAQHACRTVFDKRIGLSTDAP